MPTREPSAGSFCWRVSVRAWALLQTDGWLASSVEKCVTVRNLITSAHHLNNLCAVLTRTCTAAQEADRDQLELGRPDRMTISSDQRGGDGIHRSAARIDG